MISISSKPFLAPSSTYSYSSYSSIASCPMASTASGSSLRVLAVVVSSAWNALFPIFFMVLIKWHVTSEVLPDYLFKIYSSQQLSIFNILEKTYFACLWLEYSSNLNVNSMRTGIFVCVCSLYSASWNTVDTSGYVLNRHINSPPGAARCFGAWK